VGVAQTGISRHASRYVARYVACFTTVLYSPENDCTVSFDGHRHAHTYLSRNSRARAIVSTICTVCEYS
jgi:hypothetical protein